MQGPDGVRDAIADLLWEVLPAKVEGLRRAFDIGRGDFPDVAHVSYGEIPQQTIGNNGDVYVEVINPRLMAGMQWVDWDVGYPVYRLRYSCRLYIWAIGDDWATSLNRRDNTMNAVRQSLFEYPTLSTTPGDTGRVIHWDTYTEEYGQPSPLANQTGRCWTPGMCAVDMWSEETMRDGALRPPIGENRRAQLGTTLLGPNEPIPDDLPRPDGFTAFVAAPETAPPDTAPTDTEESTP